jgi:capsule polysaccharide export protein KpsE/RkpR
MNDKYSKTNNYLVSKYQKLKSNPKIANKHYDNIDNPMDNARDDMGRTDRYIGIYVIS